MFTKKQSVTAKLIEKNWLILQFFFITMTSLHLSKTHINRKPDFRVLGTYNFSSRKKLLKVWKIINVFTIILTFWKKHGIGKASTKTGKFWEKRYEIKDMSHFQIGNFITEGALKISRYFEFQYFITDPCRLKRLKCVNVLNFRSAIQLKEGAPKLRKGPNFFCFCSDMFPKGTVSNFKLQEIKILKQFYPHVFLDVTLNKSKQSVVWTT